VFFNQSTKAERKDTIALLKLRRKNKESRVPQGWWGGNGGYVEAHTGNKRGSAEEKVMRSGSSELNGNISGGVSKGFLGLLSGKGKRDSIRRNRF